MTRKNKEEKINTHIHRNKEDSPTGQKHTDEERDKGKPLRRVEPSWKQQPTTTTGQQIT